MSGGRAEGRGGASANSTSELRPLPTRQPPPDSTDDLDVLKVQARAVEGQLAALNQRIEQLRRDTTTRRLTAVVDSDKCIACGNCADVCDAGAITIDDVASVDAGKCTACGQCVAQCPVEGITLAKA